MKSIHEANEILEGKEIEEINENDSNEKENDKSNKELEEEKILKENANSKPQLFEIANANAEWNFNLATQNSEDESPFLDAYKNFYQTKFDKFLENAIFHEYVISKY